LPEILGEGDVESIMVWLVFGMMLFYVLERFLFWYHCHDEDCHVHSIPALVTIGDSIHNAIDGVVIASTFLLDPKLGWLTTFAVFAHEIPQEIGDFSALIHSGMNRNKIAWLNVISALFSPVVAILSYFFISKNFVLIATAISAGNLIYLACADLIPEIHHEFKYKKALTQVVLTLLGVFLIWLLVRILPHG
jgi:zinc and cadmium transporter